MWCYVSQSIEEQQPHWDHTFWYRGILKSWTSVSITLLNSHFFPSLNLMCYRIIHGCLQWFELQPATWTNSCFAFQLKTTYSLVSFLLLWGLWLFVLVSTSDNYLTKIVVFILGFSETIRWMVLCRLKRARVWAICRFQVFYYWSSLKARLKLYNQKTFFFEIFNILCRF